MADKKQLNILYTNIGRGHPFYLDGLCDEIKHNHSDKININIVNVFELSSGMALMLWKLVRFMYHRGSQGGLFGKLYKAIRKNKTTDSYGLVEKILARGIRSFIKKNRYPTLVAHPMLIPMILDLTEVYYQHGELVVPDIVVVDKRPDTKIFVPSDDAKNKFSQKGVNANSIITTGLSVEKKLKDNAEKYYEQRIERLKSNKILTGAFFSSGAEPIGHLNKIVRMLLSLQKSGQRGIVFCRAAGRLEKEVSLQIGAKVIDPSDHKEKIISYFKNRNILMVRYNDRDEENSFINILFKYFDYFVSPSHERTNWAIGLGIPMFILYPLIGPFSPINRNILLNYEVAKEILDDKTADDFGENIGQLVADGNLVSMAENGFGNFPLNGFSQICKYLERQLSDV